MKKLLTILLIPFVLFGCKRRNTHIFDHVTRFSDSSFIHIKPELVKGSLDPGIGKHFVDIMQVINENTIAIIDDRKTLSLYDKNLKKIQEFSYENTPGLQLVSPMSIFKTRENEFNIYDLTTDLIYNFIKETSNNSWKLARKQKLPGELSGLVSIAMANDSTMLATSINNINGRLINFTLKPEPKVLKYIGDKIDINGNSPFVTGLVYWSDLAHDSTDVNFVAYHKTDIFEAYNRNGKLIFRMKGPEKFDPLYRTIGKIDKQRYTENKETKSAFVSIVSDSRFVYLLYSGRTNAFSDRHKAQKVYILTKTGKPYKTFELNISTDLNKMIIDKYHEKLYITSFSEETGSLIYSVSTKTL
ncbi:MAG: hypothetical protein JWR38_2844 [Mucilaginibacter sp.]|nr:hypothetical protein [Mucilaginibacter sp.]